jgi:hypothetical protein
VFKLNIHVLNGTYSVVFCWYSWILLYRSAVLLRRSILPSKLQPRLGDSNCFASSVLKLCSMVVTLVSTYVCKFSNCLVSIRILFANSSIILGFAAAGAVL